MISSSVSDSDISNILGCILLSLAEDVDALLRAEDDKGETVFLGDDGEVVADGCIFFRGDRNNDDDGDGEAAVDIDVDVDAVFVVEEEILGIFRMIFRLDVCVMVAIT